jgi:hypothetical protein
LVTESGSPPVARISGNSSSGGNVAGGGSRTAAGSGAGAGAGAGADAGGVAGTLAQAASASVKIVAAIRDVRASVKYALIKDDVPGC